MAAQIIGVFVKVESDGFSSRFDELLPVLEKNLQPHNYLKPVCLIDIFCTPTLAPLRSLIIYFTLVFTFVPKICVLGINDLIGFNL